MNVSHSHVLCSRGFVYIIEFSTLKLRIAVAIALIAHITTDTLPLGVFLWVYFFWCYFNWLDGDISGRVDFVTMSEVPCSSPGRAIGELTSQYCRGSCVCGIAVVFVFHIISPLVTLESDQRLWCCLIFRDQIMVSKAIRCNCLAFIADVSFLFTSKRSCQLDCTYSLY